MSVLARDWSAILPGSPLGRLLRLPLRLLPRGRAVPILTGPNRGFRWVVGSSLHRCWLGTYELAKMQVLARFVRPGMSVFDIGANAGFYTLLFSRLVGERGAVWAFEPLAENAQNLLVHARLNRLSNVTLVQAAVSQATDLLSFHIAENRLMGALCEGPGRYRVPTVSLDELVERGIAPRPDLIKMDVERGEEAVIEGAQSLLRRARPVLFVALHGTTRACQRALAGLGYQLCRLDGTPLGPEPAETDEVYALPAR